METLKQRCRYQRESDLEDGNLPLGGYPDSYYTFESEQTIRTAMENKKRITPEHKQDFRESKIFDDPSRRNRTSFTGKQLMKLEEEFQREKYISRHKRCQMAFALDLPENTIKVWFQNRRMKSKRQQSTTNWPYSYDPHTQSYLAAAPATPCTYTRTQPTTPLLDDASISSPNHLPTPLYYVAPSPNLNSPSPSGSHVFCLGQSSEPNLGTQASLARATATPEIQHCDDYKTASPGFGSLHPSNINNGAASSFVKPQDVYFSLLQKYLQQRHFYPNSQPEQQNARKAFLAGDPPFSDGLYSLPQSLSSNPDCSTLMSGKPILLSPDNAGGGATTSVSRTGFETENTLSDIEIVID